MIRTTVSGLFALIGVLTLANAEGVRADAAGPSVTTFHNGTDRHGVYVEPTIGFAQAPRMQRVTSFDGRVTGHVYAQPLFWQLDGATSGRVIVATESNHVVALDATSGAVAWDQVLGAPVPGSILPCGNIDPVGITGTPVIDPAHRAIYLLATIDVGGQPRARAFGLSLADGAVLPGWPVDIADGLAAIGARFDNATQGQRSALTLLGDQAYVNFAGRTGDCGTYHGWVVGIDVLTHKIAESWQTRGDRGGIWAVGGMAAIDGGLFVATGNTHGASSWADGEAVIHLAPSLQHSFDPHNFFTPTNWQQLDATDADLGSSNPTPLTIGTLRLIVAIGKDGVAHVLDRTNLGGIGGALADAPVAVGAISNGPVAWDTPNAGFMAFHAAGSNCPAGHTGKGLLELRITPPPNVAVETVWCATLSGAGSPIVTTTDGRSDRIIWIVGADGDDRLHGFRADTGAVLFNGGTAADRMVNVHHFSTIIAANGRIYVPADDRIYAFAPQ
jgi:outer membrane protein assembly factor BamB